MKHRESEDVARLRRFFARWEEIPDGEWARFRPLVGTASLAKGEQFTRVGDAKLRIGFVLEGLLRAYYVSDDGDEFVRSFIPEDEIAAAFGASIMGEPSNVIIEALEDTTLLTFDVVAFRGLFARHLAWSELGRKLAERYYVLRELHAYQLLTMTGRERYLAFAKRSPKLVRRVSQKHVAGYLGMTPVSLNRVIASLRKAAQVRAR